MSKMSNKYLQNGLNKKLFKKKSKMLSLNYEISLKTKYRQLKKIIKMKKYSLVTSKHMSMRTGLAIFQI